MTTPQGQRVEVPPLQWNEEDGKGQYANTVNVLGSGYEITLDFSFRTGVARVVGQPIEGRHFHVARVILGLQAARELRDLLNKNVKEG